MPIISYSHLKMRVSICTVNIMIYMMEGDAPVAEAVSCRGVFSAADCLG